MPFISAFLLLNFTIHQDRIASDTKITFADVIGLEPALLIHHKCSGIGAFDLQIDLLDTLFFKVYQKPFQDSCR